MTATYLINHTPSANHKSPYTLIQPLMHFWLLMLCSLFLPNKINSPLVLASASPLVTLPVITLIVFTISALILLMVPSSLYLFLTYPLFYLLDITHFPPSPTSHPAHASRYSPFLPLLLYLSHFTFVHLGFLFLSNSLRYSSLSMFPFILSLF